MIQATCIVVYCKCHLFSFGRDGSWIHFAAHQMGHILLSLMILFQLCTQQMISFLNAAVMDTQGKNHVRMESFADKLDFQKQYTFMDAAVQYIQFHGPDIAASSGLLPAGYAQSMDAGR